RMSPVEASAAVRPPSRSARLPAAAAAGSWSGAGNARTDRSWSILGGFATCARGTVRACSVVVVARCPPQAVHAAAAARARTRRPERTPRHHGPPNMTPVLRRAERQHAELRRRTLEEAADDDELVEIVGRERRRNRGACRQEVAVDPAADEEELVLRRPIASRHDQPEPQPAQLLEPPEPGDHELERGDPVAQARRLLIPQALRELGHARGEAGERLAVEEVRELRLGAA